MNYPYNYQQEQLGDYAPYQQQQRHHPTAFISDTSSPLNTTYINNHQMNQINLSNNNALNPSLITNMTINNGYSPFPSNQLIEQQIPPRMAMNMNMNMMNTHLMAQHGQIQNMNIQNINIHIQPYTHQFHNNYNQNNNRNRTRNGKYLNYGRGNNNNHNANNRRRSRHHHGQNHHNNHSQHHHNNHHNANNANNPRGFQPKDAEFPWHLPPRLQRARAQKKLKKKMKQQQRKQMQRQTMNIHYGPLYLYNASIPPPPSRQPPSPPPVDYSRDLEQYPPLPDIRSVPNEQNNNKSSSNRAHSGSTRKRRRRGRQGNNNKNGHPSTPDNDGQKKNNMVLHQVQSQDIIGDDGNDGDYAFMHQFVNNINDDDVPDLDPIIDLNLNDNHFKSMEQEIVDNVFLLQQDHEHMDNMEHEQSVITNDNISQYSSATTYGGNSSIISNNNNNNNVSVTIGELFGDISCSSSYTKSNTNSPNPKKNKLYNNHNDIVSLSKIEW